MNATCTGCGNAADPNGKWARCVQCVTKLEAEVAKLSAEKAQLLSVEKDYARKIVENERLTKLVQGIEGIVDESDPAFFEENALARNWYERLYMKVCSGLGWLRIFKLDELLGGGQGGE